MSFPGDENVGANSQKMVYPLDLLSQVAAKISVDADLALQQHETLWKNVQAFLHEHDVDGKMAAVLGPHEQRMRDGYNWQIQLATTLFSAIDAVSGADQNVADNFSHDHGRTQGNIF